jgi:tRNA A37 threonylcarbamoyladenosine biosynthesis protein TsaE
LSNREGICLVEWPDRIPPSMMPTEYLTIKIENNPEDFTPENKDFPTIGDESNKVEGDEDRVITLVARGPKWIDRLQGLECELYDL